MGVMTSQHFTYCLQNKKTLNTGFYENGIYPFKYGILEILRHEKIPETDVLATLLTGNAWLFIMEKRSLAYQVSTIYFRIFRFLEVCFAQI